MNHLEAIEECARQGLSQTGVARELGVSRQYVSVSLQRMDLHSTWKMRRYEKSVKVLPCPECGGKKARLAKLCHVCDDLRAVKVYVCAGCGNSFKRTRSRQEQYQKAGRKKKRHYCGKKCRQGRGGREKGTKNRVKR